VQINESRSNDIVVGFGYKISDFRLFGSGTTRKISKAQRGSKNSKKDDNSKNSSTQNNKKSGVNHDLNLRLDISFRDQAAITRDIATRTSSASSGNAAVKISFMADYTLSRLLTLSAYFERQTNKPLLSSSSYPTTTHDFGLSMKFSLTR
jgi:cell surface protein SprA